MITTEDIKNLIPSIVEDADDVELEELKVVLELAVEEIDLEQSMRMINIRLTRNK